MKRDQARPRQQALLVRFDVAEGVRRKNCELRIVPLENRGERFLLGGSDQGDDGVEYGTQTDDKGARRREINKNYNPLMAAKRACCSKC